jgi:hypothetical protein
MNRAATRRRTAVDPAARDSDPWLMLIDHPADASHHPPTQ